MGLLLLDSGAIEPTYIFGIGMFSRIKFSF